MKTVNDIEERFKEKVLGVLEELNLITNGYCCSVRLHGKKKDKKSNASFEKSWSPDTDSINIRFQRIAEQSQEGSQLATQDTAAASPDYSTQPLPDATDPLADLIRVLDHAESRPGYKFVALKWFRDTALPAEGAMWASDFSARKMILGDAIKKRLVLPYPVSNPKSPQFPVTAIRLNRLMPQVKEILGSADDRISGFEPVPIRGESLSLTVLSDRR